MTFSLRRKRPTTLRAALRKAALKITSALVAWLLFLAGAQAQTQVITPRFVPANSGGPFGVIGAAYAEPAGRLTPVAAQRDMQRGPMIADETEANFLRTELPGPQRLFMRDSEAQFFDRLAQSMKKADGSRAIFPEDPVVSKEPYQPRNFPHMVELVEPSYVCHAKLYWDQPNFERIGYNLGILQPAICLGVFYYDTLLFPYHYWSDIRSHDDTSAGKCLPGDQAPLTVSCERFSVTGLLGQSGAAIGYGFLFP